MKKLPAPQPLALTGKRAEPQKTNPNLSQVISTFVGEAQARPDAASEICGEAARYFAGLAQLPANRKLATRLQQVAQEFAAAAQRPATSDDFHELLQDTASATEEVDDQDELGIVARRREIYDDRNPEAPHVCIAPETLTRDATLGRVATVKYAPTPDETKLGIVQQTTVAFWQGAKREAQAITVDVNVVKPPEEVAGSLTPLFARAFGLVEFGSDGNTTKVKFDVGGGVRFTVAGNYVSVNIGMEQTPNGRTSGTMTIGCSIGMFAAPSQAPIFCTEYLSLANGEVSSLIRRPVKAVQLFPPQSSLLGGSATFDFLDAGEVILYRLTINNGALTAPIPLSNDVAYVRVTNNAGGALFRLPFQLSM